MSYVPQEFQIAGADTLPGLSLLSHCSLLLWSSGLQLVAVTKTRDAGREHPNTLNAQLRPDCRLHPRYLKEDAEARHPGGIFARIAGRRSSPGRNFLHWAALSRL